MNDLTEYIRVARVNSTFELGMITGRLYNRNIDNVSTIDNNDGTFDIIVKPGTRNDLKELTHEIKYYGFPAATYINTKEE